MRRGTAVLDRELAQLEALDEHHVTLFEESMNHVGIADLSIRGDWADLAAFADTIAEVAARIGAEGAEAQHEGLDVRRAMAVGILADPARALAILTDAVPSTGPTPSRRKRTLRLVLHLSEANLLGLDPAATDSEQRAHLDTVIRGWAGRADVRPHVQPIRHCGGCPDCDHHDPRANHHAEAAVYQPATCVVAAVTARDRQCQFPYCHRPSDRCDLDHRIPFDSGGATCSCNLTPLCRHHHRLKTHAGWTYTSIEPGVYLWRDRYDQTFLRTRDGTTMAP